MKSEITVKQEQILEAAIRRFSHFGIAKTTLTEIADDLALTKQALAYYFPDKQSLVVAVEEKITGDFINDLSVEMTAAGSVEKALLKLTEVKTVFFEKYFMLAMQADHSEHTTNRSLLGWKELIKEKELKLLVPVFEKGAENGELKPLDAEKTGRLFLDTLDAFSRCIKDKGAFPSADAFKDVFAKQKEVISLFYQGLKAETVKA
jgi:TetR/AcrR family transcriptional repressor of mexJK operon